jgi:type IV secretion system protein TrbL
MVLAVIVGIGSGFFSEFKSATNVQQPDLLGSMSLVLASLALLGLGIFGPGIASGLVAGAPQLGAGAAIGTTAAAIGTVAAGSSAVTRGAGALGGAALGAVRAATSMGGAASSSYRLGQETPETASASAGVGTAAGTSIKNKVTNGGGIAASGQGTALFAGPSHAPVSDNQAGASSQAPQWARRLRAEQSARHHRQSAMQAIREGDGGGAAANPDIKEKEE